MGLKDRCVMAHTLQCTPTRPNGGRDIYLGADGQRYCARHLPDKRWEKSCTHSLGLPCAFCGKAEP